MSPSPGPTGGESPSRSGLGWFVALILGLILIWVLMAGCGTLYPPTVNGG